MKHFFIWFIDPLKTWRFWMPSFGNLANRSHYTHFIRHFCLASYQTMFRRYPETWPLKINTPHFEDVILSSKISLLLKLIQLEIESKGTNPRLFLEISLVLLLLRSIIWCFSYLAAFAKNLPLRFGENLQEIYFPSKSVYGIIKKKKKSVQIRFATEIDFYFRLEKLYKKLKKDDRFFSWCGICAIIGWLMDFMLYQHLWGYLISKLHLNL